MPKLCRDCQSPDLVPRGKGFRNQCHACWAATQRAAWAANREAKLVASRANYTKHAAKRREESAAHKRANPEYYALAEWLRRKGVRIGELDPADTQALIDMRKAVKEAKQAVRDTQSGDLNPHKT